jgi:DNA-binding response OmpR family regulator
MAKFSYESSDAVVYDPAASHRNASKAALYTLGFHKVETAPSLDAFNECLWRVQPDLALCDAQGTGEELCDMIQTLRQGRTGHSNPFLVIIITAWEKNHSLVHRVLNSGADDLLLRPFSIGQLCVRIDAHVERRKQFVVTHDYVGPDRRSDPTRITTIEPFVPPNSLQMKARDGVSMAEAQTRLSVELKKAKETLNNQKLCRDAYQICVLWRLLQEQDAIDNISETSELSNLINLTQDILKRCRISQVDEPVLWCESVLSAVEGLQFGVDRNASMHLLGQAALSLNQLLQPQKSRADHLAAIEETVKMIHARSAGRPPAEDALPKADAV